MASYTLTPLPRIGITTGSGYKLYTYEAGTSTPAVTYSDDAGTPNANPVVANAAGLFPAIYLPIGESFKYIFTTAADVTVWTQDGIAAVPSLEDLGEVTGVAGEDLAADEVCYLSDGSGALNAGNWYRADADNGYSSIYPQIAYPIAAIASGATGAFRISGRVTGLTGLTPGTTYYISGTVGEITSTAPANARAVGIADTTTSLILSPQPRWTDQPIPVAQTITGTGVQNDFAITSGPTWIQLRCNNATDVSFTGFATPAQGKRITLVSIGAGNVFLANETGSTAANQIITSTGGDISLKAGVGRVTIVYDGTASRWRVDPGAGVISSAVFMAGAGTALMKASGLSEFDDTQAATGADTNETVLKTFTVPANTLNLNGRTIRIRAVGTFAANTNTKTLRIRWGGIGGTIIVTGTVADQADQTRWYAEATLSRIGTGSQRLYGFAGRNDNGDTLFGQQFGMTTGTQDETTDVALVVTGQNGTANANDIVFEASWVYLDN